METTIPAPTAAFYITPESRGDEAGKVINGTVIHTTKTYADVQWNDSGRVERVRYQAPFGVHFTSF